MFEPLLGLLTWGNAVQKPGLGRNSGAAGFATRSASSVMGLCSNPCLRAGSSILGLTWTFLRRNPHASSPSVRA
jgi:hypothetical protein